MTFSIIGSDPKTQSIGIAVATKWLAVGSCVPHVEPGVGAIATQAETNIAFGPKGLALLKQGISPKDVLKQLQLSDKYFETRQVSIMNIQGNTASHTGKDCSGWAGSKNGSNCVVQGNMLMSADVISSIKKSFETVEGFLAFRLIQALKSGESSGGDSRGKQSAALLVSNKTEPIQLYSDDFIDLRVDDHPDPISELGRLYELHLDLYSK